LYSGIPDKLFGVPGRFCLSICHQCRLAWMNPRPVADEIAQCYVDYYTHAAAEVPLAAPSRNLSRPRDRLRKMILGAHYGLPLGELTRWEWAVGRALALVPPLRQRAIYDLSIFPKWTGQGRMVDVGCGNGQFLTRMRSFGWHTIGVETDPSAVASAKAVGLDVSLGSLEEVGLPSGSADVIVMHHVIEHLPNPATTIAECHRVLASGGRLVIVTPNLESLGHRVFKAHWRGLEQPRHLTIWSMRALRDLLRTAGFNTFEMRTRSLVAGILWEQSSQMRDNHRADPHAVASRAGRVFQLVERALLLADRRAGEEIVCTAEKAA
jgi:SAM-dependent methyltransferase